MCFQANASGQIRQHPTQIVVTILASASVSTTTEDIWMEVVMRVPVVANTEYKTLYNDFAIISSINKTSTMFWIIFSLLEFNV